MTEPADAPAPEARDAARPGLLSIVCPAFNEAEGLAAFHRAIRREMASLGQPFEVVFVNDGSLDGTLATMRALRERHANTTIVDLSRNFGKEVAVTAGLDHARGEAAVIIDADLQHPPALIGEMIAGWREGYDVVSAKRRARSDETWFKRSMASAFYAVMGRLGDAPIPRDVGDFRLLSRKAIDAVVALRERHRFMKGVFAWVGFPSKTVPYDVAPRRAGATKWNYWRLWNLSIEGITGATIAPLRLATFLGFASAAAAFLAALYFIVKTIAFGDPVAGFPTLIVVILFLGGAQLMTLGVIGEYLGRIFNETKNRPLYFVNAVEPAAEERAAARAADAARAAG